MKPVRFSKEGEWHCPKCGTLAKGKKCPHCKFLIYAGFLPRIIAGLVDGAITLAAAKLFIILRSNSLDGYLAITLLGFIFFRLYHILFVALWGQTPGKMIARIQVVQLDGSPVGWVHAILRNSVETAIVMVVVYFEIQGKFQAIRFCQSVWNTKNKWQYCTKSTPPILYDVNETLWLFRFSKKPLYFLRF